MTEILHHPQPLGIYPLPAGYLLLPPCDGGAPFAQALMHGKLLPTAPAAWRFYQHALAGELDAAYETLRENATPLADYNRFVLRSTPEEYQRLQSVLSGELAAMLELVAYTLNYRATPPQSEQATNELGALLLMTQATHQLEQGNTAQALPLLQAASVAAKEHSPLLAAQIQASLAETRHQIEGVSPAVIQLYREAWEALEKTSLESARASVALNLGIAYQEMSQGRRAALLEAVRCYQDALRFFSRESQPEPYALAQNNLALAYLSMPLQEASDQLRMAIAVQALREALKVYQPATHPAEWASAQLNLANALQYLPSAHPQENLMEAVNIYEQLLAVRSAASDPHGYARLLANQGNALAHLGVFAHAVPKLTEAQALFTQCGELDAAASVGEVLQEIEAQAARNETAAAVGAQ